VPETRVVFYQEEESEVPVLEWLTRLLKEDRKGYANCVARIKQLAASGYELRRPAADYLRDGIYELRAKHIHVQYRTASCTSFMGKMWRFSLTLLRKKKQLYHQLILKERSLGSFYLKKAQKFTPTQRNKRMAKTSDAIKIINKMASSDPELEAMIAEASINAEVAQLIYEARTSSGLTQKQLAELIGTKQPVIARLEDADYEGHSLSMLQKIAQALNQRVVIQLAPIEHEQSA
jgi:ribosome-binding protein aMBF1 (putative translation factor)